MTDIMHECDFLAGLTHAARVEAILNHEHADFHHVAPWAEVSEA